LEENKFGGFVKKY